PGRLPGPRYRVADARSGGSRDPVLHADPALLQHEPAAIQADPNARPGGSGPRDAARSLEAAPEGLDRAARLRGAHQEVRPPRGRLLPRPAVRAALLRQRRVRLAR